ncbi:MAG: Mut7-C RNAse domain-containing protein [Chloroflexota bacterium]
MNRAAFRFYGNLNYFLTRKQRHKTIPRDFDWRGSIKDMIESLNVPHPEIELIVVNGTSVDFDYIVADGDDIHVHPLDHDSDINPQVPLRPPLTDKPRFILDTHLGRLAAYLRMASFDTLYRNDYPDDELAEVAYEENRVLLTRDNGLLKRSLVTYGYFVREINPQRRLIEIIQRYDLAQYASPYARCTRCNGLLHPVDKADIQEELSDRTASHYDAFFQCKDCRQVYWKGSHYERMQSLIQQAIAAE